MVCQRCITLVVERHVMYTSFTEKHRASKNQPEFVLNPEVPGLYLCVRVCMVRE
jgi:hypothetical protein